MSLVGLGNTRILTDYAQTAPMILLCTSPRNLELKPLPKPVALSGLNMISVS